MGIYKKNTRRMGFEPMQAKPNGLAVHHLKPLGHLLRWCGFTVTCYKITVKYTNLFKNCFQNFVRLLKCTKNNILQ